MQFDMSANSSWQFGHRGRVAVFIDGNNLFHAARFHNIDIDYNKLLRLLLGDGRLLRAFFTPALTRARNASRVFCCGCGATVFASCRRS